MLSPSLRRTGRTERMICDAIDALAHGKSSVIVAADERHRGEIAARIVAHLPSARVERDSERIWIGFDGDGISVVRDASGVVSMSDGKVRSSTALVFVDHWTVESRYGFALEEWLRYSMPEVVSPFAEPRK